MQRYNLNLKGGTYTQQDCYRLTPIYRQQVVPGSTVNIDAQINMKTASFTKLVTTPCLASVWFFYVPHRLVWEDWTDFISKSEPQTAFIGSTAKGPNYFDKTETSIAPEVSPLYRRAYKLVYNEYFNTGAGYDVTDDSSVTIMGDLKNPEQFASKIVLNSEVVDPEFTVVANSIPLNEFYRAQMNARSKQRSQMTGDKYVDTLARMGVDASWMIAERPEFLGTKSKLCAPVLTASTESATLGQEVSRFNCSLSVDIKGKHFAEHGYIVGVCGLRPLLTFTDRGAPDMRPGYNTNPSDEEWLDMFYSADNLQTKDIVWDRSNGFNTAADFANVQRFAYLKNGTWLTGKGDSWVSSATATSFEDMTYPDRTYDFINTSELGGDEFAATSSVNMSGKTPVPVRVA
jgi:sarcosine oxidase delta subunit